MGLGVSTLVAETGFAQVAAASGSTMPLGFPSVLDRVVAVDVREATIHEALERLRASTRIDFNYENVVIDSVARRVSFRAAHTSLARALAYILRGTGLIATTFDSSIIVKHAAPSVVRGRIVDSRSGQPIAGAIVLINGLWQRSVTTDSGTFRLDSLPVGNFVLETRLLGYRPTTVSVTIEPALQLVFDLQLDRFFGTLDTVVVTSTVAPTPIKDLPIPISVVTSADIQDQHYARVNDIFRGRVPGGISWQQGNFDYYSTITVRGINSLDVNNIKTYIDGVEVAEYSAANVDPNSIERIEVIRGPEASTIYGSDASGGVMQIFTKHGQGAPNQPAGSASIAEGLVQGPLANESALQQQYALSLMGALPTRNPQDEASYNLGVSYRHVGGWIPGYYSSDPGAYGGLHIDHRSVTVDLSGRYLRRDLPAITSPAIVATDIPALSMPLHIAEQEQEQTYGLHVAYKPTSWWQHSLTVGYDRSELAYASASPQFADSGLALFDQVAGKASVAYNTSASIDIGDVVHATQTLGFDHYNRTLSGASASHLPGVLGTIGDSLGTVQREPVSNTGLFAQLQIGVMDQLFVTAGLRADDNSGIGATYGYAWAPRIGLSFVRAIGDVTFKARAAYGEGIQPGLPSQRVAEHIPFATQLPNTALAPERQIGGDVGTDLVFGHLGSLSITYYNQQARDLIQGVVLKSDSTGVTLQYQNVAEINNRGLETQASLSVAGVRLDAEFSYTSSKIARLPPPSQYTGDYRVGDQALLVPLSSGGLTMSSRLWHTTDISAGVVYVGYWTSYNYPSLDSAIFTNRPLTSTRSYWLRFPAFAKFRLSVDQLLNRYLVAFVAIDNLANSHATEQNAIFAVPGRATIIGLRVTY